MILSRRKLATSYIRQNAIVFSSSVPGLNEEIVSKFENSKAKTAQSNNNTTKVKSILKVLPSKTYNNQVLDPESQFFHDISSLPKNAIIKHELFKLMEGKKFPELLQLMSQYVRIETVDIRNQLSREEISLIMRSLIDHQVSLVKSSARNKSKNNQTFKEPMLFLQGVRKLYSKLLFKEDSDHIYELTRRAQFFTTPHNYKLSVLDYENLILLELKNMKLDLASKWFQRFDEQFGLNSNNHLTLNLWILKLQLYSGGIPHTWISRNTKFKQGNEYNPRKSHFKAKIPFNNLLADFLKSFKPTELNQLNNHSILTSEFHETLIYCIGYSGNLDYLRKYIQAVWGIDKNGKIGSFTLPSAENTEYPTINTLRALTTSFSYNNEFFEAMKYINYFQSVYKIDTDGITKSSNSLWSQVFKWSGITTDFEERPVLHYFLAETKLLRQNSAKLIKDLQKDVNFDYEGYLTFVKKLKDQRIFVHEQIWELYCNTKSDYSNSIAHFYYKFLIEDNSKDIPNLEQKYYDFMIYLLNQYHKFHVRKASFNRRREITHQVNSTDVQIRDLYQQVLQALINIKWKATFAGQCEPLIWKWSLDQKMDMELSEWFTLEILPVYEEMIEQKRHEKLVELRTEDKDEDSMFNLL